MTNLAPSPSAVRRAFHEELGPGQRSALLSWVAFTGAFAGLRALTYSIRAGKGPFRNVSVGGEHLHHYMWGIALLSGVGAIAVRGEEAHRRHPAVAVSYGAGLALIVDEFALLLDLQGRLLGQAGPDLDRRRGRRHRRGRVLLRGAAGAAQAAAGATAPGHPGPGPAPEAETGAGSPGVIRGASGA